MQLFNLSLDAASHCFMLRRFKLAESRRGKRSRERFAQTGERASFGLETAANK